MNSPHALHALAAAHSLARARRTLAELARAEAEEIAAEALSAPSVLRSPVYGSPHASGGHSDPTVGMLAVADRPDRRNRWAEMGERLDGKLTWLAEQIGRPGLTTAALTRLTVAIEGGHLQPGTAASVTRHLLGEEKWVREAIRQPRPTEPLPGVACPHCGERQLHVQTAGPVDAWTVVCATGRLCRGVSDINPATSCPCGMPGAVEGVAHIWPRAAVIGAVPRRIDDLIEASSLGTPDAVAMRDRGRMQLSGELTGMSEEQADWDGADDPGAVAGAAPTTREDRP